MNLVGCQRTISPSGGFVTDQLNSMSANLLLTSELLAHVFIGLQADLALNVPLPAAQPTASLPAWPGTLPEQVRAVAQVLTTATAAMPLAALEASFKGKGPWKKGLPRILETLEALGRARREGVDGEVSWRA
jgi:hypothetical protein